MCCRAFEKSLPCVAVCCSVLIVLQCPTTCIASTDSFALYRTATHFNNAPLLWQVHLQFLAVYCSALRCSILQQTATDCNMSQYYIEGATSLTNMLQCAHCVAVPYNLHCQYRQLRAIPHCNTFQHPLQRTATHHKTCVAHLQQLAVCALYIYMHIISCICIFLYQLVVCALYIYIYIISYICIFVYIHIYIFLYICI